MIFDAETAAIAYLTETYRQVDPHEVYLNQVGDLIEEQVITSRSMVDEALYCLEHGEEPTYDQGLCGLFHQPDTFDPALRVKGLRLPDFERVVGRLLSHYR